MSRTSPSAAARASALAVLLLLVTLFGAFVGAASGSAAEPRPAASAQPEPAGEGACAPAETDLTPPSRAPRGKGRTSTGPARPAPADRSVPAGPPPQGVPAAAPLPDPAVRTVRCVVLRR
ncbi:hypothetical protein [Streptomyces sp. DH12]|uniref:hypothetical protein n=1 Tax=Streptomyces sp. DH12 TaxID=2857010 RepID=UPI001E593054|nr:hypothetical protein [Streptomyces sp. DH12]